MTELLDLVPDAILRLDADRRIVAANHATIELTGFAPDQLTGKDAREILDPRTPDGRPVWANGWPASARLRSVRSVPEQEVTLRRADTTAVRTFVTGQY